VIENKNNYNISIEYNQMKYDNEIIENISNSFIEIINHIERYNEKSSKIPYIEPALYKEIIYGFNSNQHNITSNKLYHKQIHENAIANPEKCAIVFNDETITYRKLDEMSNTLGWYLRKQGVGRNDIIPVISERSYIYVVAILGISKAGGAFLPIDPEFPEDRISYMIEEVKPKIILKYLDYLTDDNIKFLSVNYNIVDLKSMNYENKNEYIKNINDVRDICYVLFTSGTTGKPKGTIIRHDNMINYNSISYSDNGIEYKRDSYNTALAFDKFTFDQSLAEIIYSLYNNKNIIIASEEEYNNPELLASLIKNYNIDLIHSTPSRINNYIINDDFKNSLIKVKNIIFGGEGISKDIIQKIRSITDSMIFNEYGPTECTITTSIKNITKESNNYFSELITIGKPLCNYEMYILDEYMKPVPVGVEGEIYIGGKGVGNGYLNRE
jgi:amino acid adenylation domain-containing protein